MARTFRQLLGINAGKEWDQLYNTNNRYGYNPFLNIFSHVRSFHLMEDDYPKGDFPKNAKPDVRLPGSNSGWGRMNNYQLRYEKWSKDFESLRVSLTGISEFDKISKKVNMRSFPNKWYSKADWGNDEKSIIENAKRYGLAFFALHVPKDQPITPFMRTLEIGNEPWGDIGIEGYRAVLKGIISAYQIYYGEKPLLRLSSAAFQAHEPNHVWKCNYCDYPSGDYVGKILDEELLSQIHELTIHPYSFASGSVKLVEPPESSTSDFAKVRSMFDFRAKMKRPQLTISATEFGWDSGTVGEAAQAAYTLRNIVMMSAMGFYECYLYEGLDNPGIKGLYGSSGLFEVKLPGRYIARPKLIYKILLQFMNLASDLEVMESLQEDGDAYIYLLGEKGKATHLIAWRPNDFGSDKQAAIAKWISVSPNVRRQKLNLAVNFVKLDGNIQLDERLRCQTTGLLYRANEYSENKNGLERLKLSGFPALFPLK